MQLRPYGIVARVKSQGIGELQLSENEVASLRTRLRRIQGQARAIERMLEERADCHAIVQQLSATRGALDRAMVRLMVASMSQCFRGKNGRPDEIELRALGETFAKLL